MPTDAKSKNLWVDELTESLRNYYDRAHARNPRFSRTSFARKAKLSRAAMSVLLSGKAKWLTIPRAIQIIENIGLSDREKNRLLLLMGINPKVRRKSFGSIAHRILTDWTYHPILFGFELPEKIVSPALLAKRLGLKKEKVLEVIQDLILNGLLAFNEKGNLRTTNEHWMTGDGPPNKDIAKHHRDNLKIALSALEIPAAQRDFSSMTFTASAKKLELFRKEVRNFYDRLATLADEQSEAEEIYRVSVALFPFRFEKEIK